MAKGKISKNSRVDNKKKVTTFEKEQRIREKKETLLYPVSVYEEIDGKVNGKNVLKITRRFGKNYYLVDNKGE